MNTRLKEKKRREGKVFCSKKEGTENDITQRTRMEMIAPVDISRMQPIIIPFVVTLISPPRSQKHGRNAGGQHFA